MLIFSPGFRVKIKQEFKSRRGGTTRVRLLYLTASLRVEVRNLSSRLC